MRKRKRKIIRFEMETALNFTLEVNFYILVESNSVSVSFLKTVYNLYNF